MPRGIYHHKRAPLLDRFFRQILPEPNSGCWLWVGNLNAYGYAQFWLDEMFDNGIRHASIIGGHVFAYKLLVGPIPEGLQLDHLCRTRCCVNPHHLEPVTSGENTRRSILAKANWKIVSAMRERRLQGGSLTELAKEFGLTYAHTSAICCNGSWKDPQYQSKLMTLKANSGHSSETDPA